MVTLCFQFGVSGSYLARRDQTQSPGVAPSPFDSFGIPAGTDDSRYERTIGQAVARLDLGGWTAAAGADTFVAGSAIFGKPDYAATIAAMRAEISKA